MLYPFLLKRKVKTLNKQQSNSVIQTTLMGKISLLYLKWVYHEIYHCGFMICSSYRTLHFEILKLKQIFRCTGYPKNFIDRCTKIYLGRVFMKHPNI